MEYESALFDTDSIISLNIIMDDDSWNEMLENALEETYYECDVEVNGTMFYSVGIRPKGNTSLSSVVSDPTTDRYSFKLEFDHFVEGQTCFGLDKLILNNNYADATSMKEALVYDMFAYIGADASLYNYASISVNGEYWGIYLALEGVEDSFLLRNYGTQNGKLYKPDSMNMDGGGHGGGRAFSPSSSDSGAPSADAGTGLSPSRRSGSSFSPAVSDDGAPQMPGGGFSASSGGADLNYSDDDPDSYSAIWDGEVIPSGKSDHRRVVTALKNISEGSELETYMDVDNILRYMAVHIFSVNDDSLSGSMAHNYYLYEHSGQLNILPWDYNLAFGGMNGGDAASVINSPIDDAFSITDFFDGLMASDVYHAQYYEYLHLLVDDYVNGGGFDAFYTRVRSQIDELTGTDPNALYTYDEYAAACEMLYKTVKLRAESVSGQISGTLPSTESSQRSSDGLIEADGIDLTVMGVMNGGRDGGGRADGDMQHRTDDDGSTHGDWPVSAPDFKNTAFPDGEAQQPVMQNAVMLCISAAVIILALIASLLFRRRIR